MEQPKVRLWPYIVALLLSLGAVILLTYGIKKVMNTATEPVQEDTYVPVSEEGEGEWPVYTDGKG